MPRLRGVEQLRLLSEAQQVAVVAETFNLASGMEAVIQRIDEVERRVAGDQLEADRPRIVSECCYNH